MSERDDYDAAEQRVLRGGDAPDTEHEHLSADEVAERRLEGEWHHELMEYADVDRIEPPDVDPGFTYSKSYTRAEMERWMGEDLREVRKLRAEGYTHDDFANMIRSEDPRDQEIGRTYRGLFGDNAIKVDWNNGKWEVQDGAHRLTVAKQLGVGHVPVRASAPEKWQLADLKYST